MSGLKVTIQGYFYLVLRSDILLGVTRLEVVHEGSSKFAEHTQNG